MRHDQAVAKLRGALAVELRAQGLTYSEIAETLDYRHRSSARKAALRTIRERADLAVDVYRVNRYFDLEDIGQRSFPAALKGDARALARCLRAAQERVELFGGARANA
jgi:hypothetical protein